MNLYELTEQYKELYSLFDCGEIDADVFFDTLEGLNGEIDDKIDATCIVIKNKRAEVDAILAEIERLEERAKAIHKETERMGERLKALMQRVGRDRFDSARHTVRFNKGEKIHFTDPERLFDWLEEHYPDKVTTKTVRNASKNDVKALTKLGVNVPYCESEITMNINIK